jgi:hypothetical protein
MEVENKSHYEKYKQTIIDYQQKNKEKYQGYSRDYQRRKRAELKAKKEKEFVENYLKKNLI